MLPTMLQKTSQLQQVATHDAAMLQKNLYENTNLQTVESIYSSASEACFFGMNLAALTE